MARISRTQLAAEHERIAHLVGQHPEGLNRVALAEAYRTAHGRAIEPRTLRRRLQELVEGGRLAVAGPANAPIYRAATADEARTDAGADYVPLSAAGRATRALITRPTAQRPPVGYNRDMLFSYRPGTTWYLPKSLRHQLHEMGRTPDDTRPADTFARDVLSRLLIDLSWASSRLEGNTYSRLDTQNLLEFGQHAEGKDATETQMILNHKEAIELLVREVKAPVFPRMLLRGLHRTLSENLLTDPADEGRLRERVVQITGTTYTPNAIPQVIRDCHDRIIDTVGAIPDPLEQAFFLMVHVPYLQPFVDVNKRTSRLAANWPLLHANLSPLSFIEVPDRAYVEGTLAVYELQRVDLLRDVFAWAYARSCAQYRVVRESVPQPDALRLRYRSQLHDVVRATVHSGEAPQARVLRARGAALSVAPDDLDGFAERAMAELLNLHEGSASRYQLRSSDVSDWRERFRADVPPRVGALQERP
ncbi:MAG: cell filamentation protein Fic [Gemmatimonas sp.]|nr:cell filamentation protein Fic [Gemmatimonas sp.]